MANLRSPLRSPLRARLSGGLAALLVLGVAAGAGADVLVLVDGQRLEGVVREGKSEVTVVLDYGEVAFARSDVAEIVRSDTSLHAFETRRAALAPNDVAGHVALAQWAEREGLAASARGLYRQVVALDPSHRRAHEALGHIQHEGKWLTYAEHQSALGRVQYFGKWMTAEQAAEARSADQVAREARARPVAVAAPAEVAQAPASEDPSEDLNEAPWYGAGQAPVFHAARMYAPSGALGFGFGIGRGGVTPVFTPTSGRRTAFTRVPPPASTLPASRSPVPSAQPVRVTGPVAPAR